MLAPIAAVALLATAFAASPHAVMASPPTPGPFVCAPGFYQVINGQLNLLDPVTGTYTPIGTQQLQYNAMGYDPIDNYLYAISSDASDKGSLLRIANDGSITPLGVPAGLPAASYAAGAFDNLGNLIVRGSATTWYSINVVTNIATTLTISGASDAGNDIAWIGGIAYLLSGVAGTTTLYAVNLATGVATSATVPGITGAGGTFGAAWSDNPNDLFFSDNSSGRVFLINGFTTASPTGSLLVDGQAASTNDGASCKLAANPFEAPTANADSYSTPYNTPLTVNAATGVLANDVGAGISVTSSTSAGAGTAVVQSDGSFTYTPVPGATGTDTFNYTVTDAFNRTSSATVSIAIVLPAAPVAVDDLYSVTANGTLSVPATSGLLANDTGYFPQIFSHTPPAHGVVLLNGDGSFTYVPSAGFSGIDTIPYTIDDLFSRTASATATLVVHPIAAAIIASGTGPGAIFTAPPPAPVGVGPFTYALASTPPTAAGVAVMNPSSGQMQFTPAFGFSGVVPNFTYTVTDAASVVSAPANITMTVNEPAVPVAGNDAYNITADGTLTETAVSGLLTNDTGPGIVESGIGAPPAGTVHINPNGSFVYSPVVGFSGTDSFTYTVTDEYSRTASATVTITVDPVALDVTGSGTGPGAIHLTPASPVGTGPFTFHLVTMPPVGDGTATMDVNTGVITFTPAAGFHGAVPLFTYVATDGIGNVSAAANIDLSVGTPTPPTTSSLSGTTRANQAITLTPATPIGSGPFTFALATTPPAGDGVATIDPNTGAVVFTPALGFSGIVPPFTYVVTDTYAQASVPENVSIDVTPLSEGAAGAGAAGAPITVQPPAPVGVGPFTFTIVPGSLPAADGTATIDSTTGAITFTPAKGFSGSVTLRYTVTDADGLTSSPSVVTFDVAAAAIVTTTTTAVPTTGAVEAPMLGGGLLVGIGLLLMAFAAVRRRRGTQLG